MKDIEKQLKKSMVKFYTLLTILILILAVSGFYFGWIVKDKLNEDHNNILLFENINLRGYKNALIEHFDTCKCHKNCYRMPK